LLMNKIPLCQDSCRLLFLGLAGFLLWYGALKLRMKYA
jgi:hypothetical protein